MDAGNSLSQAFVREGNFHRYDPSLNYKCIVNAIPSHLTNALIITICIP